MGQTVFFYGGLMNPRMLERLGIADRPRSTAVLSGYELRISPWVDVAPRDAAEVHGVLMEMEAQELDAMYGQLKVAYRPVEVDVATAGGRRVAARCYVVAGSPEPRQPDEAHVRMLLDAAEANGFPAPYLEHIRSFLPST